MDGPPEMVEGMVMKVMTSCSLRPASRARKPPMAWMPSWELPAMRMTASGTVETRGPWPDEGTTADSLMEKIGEVWRLSRRDAFFSNYSSDFRGYSGAERSTEHAGVKWARR